MDECGEWSGRLREWRERCVTAALVVNAVRLKSPRSKIGCKKRLMKGELDMRH